MEPLRKKLSLNRPLRALVLKLLKLCQFDLPIRNCWVPGARLTINSFCHKGYWFYGKHRERSTMKLFRKIIKPGDTVLEVGGHIGFISQYFASIIGPTGALWVFEPGSNNLPYLRKNLHEGLKYLDQPKIELVEKAVSDHTGETTFYEESLTGQNNSVVKDFEGLEKNRACADVLTAVTTCTVDAIKLDDLFLDKKIDFIKIDVEGHEWNVLMGAQQIIKKFTPAIMVEVQANENEIYDFLTSFDYKLYDESQELLEDFMALKGNVFALQHQHLKSIDL